jgi:hypothetical protein
MRHPFALLSVPVRRRTAARRLMSLGALVLLCCGLVALAACGEDDQRVPESFPSGARPAPVPATDEGAMVEVPPPPPAEPRLQTAVDAAPASPAAVPAADGAEPGAAAASSPGSGPAAPAGTQGGAAAGTPAVPGGHPAKKPAAAAPGSTGT